MRHLFVFFLTVLWSVPLFAQSDDAVIIARFGGVQELPVRDLVENNGSFSVISLGNKRVVPFGEDVRIADIKMLPDGSHLLADVNGRGVAITSPDGLQYRYELDPFLRMTSVRAASVASYFSPGQPSIVALTDSASQFASLREVSTNRVAWFETFRDPSATADIVQIAVLPNNFVAVAVNWAGLGLSAIDVFDLSNQIALPTRFANRNSPLNPPNTAIVPDLETIRDIMVLEDGSFLVATKFSIVNFDAMLAQVNWSFEIGDDPDLGGEFSSARMLPSGRVALATYQPGEWTRANTNHRVHWLDLDTQTVVATSDVFLSAPTRVEPLAGHGGTGTFGFTSGLEEIGQGDPTLVETFAFDVSSEVERGDRLQVALTVVNTDQFLVGLATLLIEGRPGTCSERGPIAEELARAESVAITPGGSFPLVNEPLVTSTFPLGDWCATIRFEDVTGQWHDLEPAVDFSVVTKKTTTDSTIADRDLPFDRAPTEDAGLGDTGADVGPTPSSGGGCCRTAKTNDTPGAHLFLILGLFFFLKIRRQPAQ